LAVVHSPHRVIEALAISYDVVGEGLDANLDGSTEWLASNAEAARLLRAFASTAPAVPVGDTDADGVETMLRGFPTTTRFLLAFADRLDRDLGQPASPFTEELRTFVRTFARTFAEHERRSM